MNKTPRVPGTAVAGNYAACPGFEDFTEDSETFEIGAEPHL